MWQAPIMCLVCARYCPICFEDAKMKSIVLVLRVRRHVHKESAIIHAGSGVCHCCRVNEAH